MKLFLLFILTIPEGKRMLFFTPTTLSVSSLYIFPLRYQYDFLLLQQSKEGGLCNLNIAAHLYCTSNETVSDTDVIVDTDVNYSKSRLSAL